MNTIRKVLVPTDFSEFSLSALDYVESMSSLHEAHVYLLNILESDSVLAFHSADHQPETAMRDRQATAEDILKRMIASKSRKKQDMVPVVRQGDPAKEIVRFAEEEALDLIVMATHGRTGLAHAVIGSVTEKVVRHSRVPVLTVQPDLRVEALLKNEDIEEQLHLKL